MPRLTVTLPADLVEDVRARAERGNVSSSSYQLGAALRSAPEAPRCMRVLDAGALIALDRGDRDTWA